MKIDEKEFKKLSKEQQKQVLKYRFQKKNPGLFKARKSFFIFIVLSFLSYFLYQYFAKTLINRKIFVKYDVDDCLQDKKSLTVYKIIGNNDYHYQTFVLTPGYETYSKKGERVNLYMAMVNDQNEFQKINCL